jgi:hypothetical protein
LLDLQGGELGPGVGGLVGTHHAGQQGRIVGEPGQVGLELDPGDPGLGGGSVIGTVRPERSMPSR